MFRPFEIDETYLGAKLRNRHASKLDEKRVVGIKNSATNRVVAIVVSDAKAKTVEAYISSKAKLGESVYAD